MNNINNKTVVQFTYWRRFAVHKSKRKKADGFMIFIL